MVRAHSPLAAMLTSLLVFAGASMSPAQLLASGTPALLVILHAVHQSSFMMYSASLRVISRMRRCAGLLIAYLVPTTPTG